MADHSSSALATTGRSLSTVAVAELPKYFTRAEVGQLLSVCKGGRDRLMAKVMWQTGVRVSELLSLSAGAIDWEAQVLRVVTLKRRGHVRTIPLRPGLLGKLARHLAEGGIASDRPQFALSRHFSRWREFLERLVNCGILCNVISRPGFAERRLMTPKTTFASI